MVLIACALIWRRPDLLVIATPFAVVDRLVGAHPTEDGTDVRRASGPRDDSRGGRDRPGTAHVSGVRRVGPRRRRDRRRTVDRYPAGERCGHRRAPSRASRSSTSVCGRPAGGCGRSSVCTSPRPRPWAAFRWSAVTSQPLDDDAAPPGRVRCRRRRAPVGRAHRAPPIRPIGRGQRVRRDPTVPAGDRLRRINWTRSACSTELQVNSTWADLDTHIALVVDATDDFGVSEGIDGLASSLDGAVRAAGAIAEHYAPRGERVSLRTFGTTSPLIGAAGDRSRPVTSDPRHAGPAPTHRPAAEARVTAARPHEPSIGGQITVMLSPLIAPEALDLVVSLGRQGTSVIVVDTLPDHVTEDEDPFTALAWRIRLLERRRELRLVHGRRDSRRAMARTREPRPGDPRHRASCDRTTDAAAMSVRLVQQWIDQLWLVSWQRWVFIATAIVAAVAARRPPALAAGHQTALVVVLIARAGDHRGDQPRLARGARARSDRGVAVAREHRRCHRPWVIPMALWLFLFHAVVALMAVTPISADRRSMRPGAVGTQERRSSLSPPSACGRSPSC